MPRRPWCRPSRQSNKAGSAEIGQRDDVRRQMVALGVEPAEAAARAAALSDPKVREIAGQLDRLPAGQSAVGAVVGAALLIFLVLLITDLLGLTDVFPFVNR